MDDDEHKRAGPKKWQQKQRKAPRPLDARQIDEMALGYVARFATSAGRLTDYLKRKIRERGWDGEAPADLAGVVERLVTLGYIDDAGFAQARGAGLMRRGFGARRITETLARDGIAAPLIAQAGGSELERRTAALEFARRKRLGPFGRGSADGGDSRLDPATRTRQVAAMMRAGHPLASARAMVEAGSGTAAQEWVDEADDS
ncbi:regulatory protein RecX [Novosphingobium sp.]|uniref:regulatory protein RecX n=1 Tax=Novosphingobium sp. TaxID=1874826 RepID=UPI003D0D65F2